MFYRFNKKLLKSFLRFVLITALIHIGVLFIRAIREGDIKILEGELEQAKRSKDEALVKSKSEEIKKVELEIKGFNEKVEDIREDIKSYQDKLKGIQEQINDKLKELIF